eukprot:360591-Chlamydomonas_euryale.AAC.21
MSTHRRAMHDARRCCASREKRAIARSADEDAAATAGLGDRLFAFVGATHACKWADTEVSLGQALPSGAGGSRGTAEGQPSAHARRCSSTHWVCSLLAAAVHKWPTSRQAFLASACREEV